MSRRKRSTPPTTANPTEDTMKILLRAQSAMQKFDQQLHASRMLSNELRRELSDPKPQKTKGGTPSARARRGRSA